MSESAWVVRFLRHFFPSFFRPVLVGWLRGCLVLGGFAGVVEHSQRERKRERESERVRERVSE